MSLRQFLFGPRWSLCFIHGKTHQYELYGDSVIAILGTIGPMYLEGLKPIPPWELHLYSHKAKRGFTLYPDYFLPGGGLSRSLLEELNRLVPNYNETIEQPIFEELKTRRKIPLTAPSIVEHLAQNRDIDSYLEIHDNSFWSVMDKIFGR